MSGLEVVAGVAAIVSGFASGLSLYRLWRAKQREKAGLGRDLKAEQILDQAGMVVEQKYYKLAVLGEKFAVGDDITRMQLMTHLVTLQQSVILLLNNAIIGNDTVVHSADLIATSKSVRNGSIQALVDQYQRMMVTAPITSSRFSMLKLLPLARMPSAARTPSASITPSPASTPNSAKTPPPTRTLSPVRTPSRPAFEKKKSFIALSKDTTCPGAAQYFIVKASDIGECSHPGCIFTMSLATSCWIAKKNPGSPSGAPLYFRLTSSYFHKSHLQLENDHNLAKKNRYSCFLCMKMGKMFVPKFRDINTYWRHVGKAHTIDEYKSVQIEESRPFLGDGKLIHNMEHF